MSEIGAVLEGDWTTLGDTDRDGNREIISLDYTSVWRVDVVERQPDNSYTVNYPLGTGYLLTYATGDTDGDGKMEIIAQDGDRVIVLESENPWSYPNTLVWTSPPLTNVGGKTTVADSDSDGRPEIIHSRNTFGGTARLVIFESTGDNEYQQVFDAPTPGNGATGEKAIVDLDQDGHREIALCGIRGYLYLFESIANDQWQQVWFDSTGFLNSYSAEGGADSDGNGRPELFIRGNDVSNWPTRVYEAKGDNDFHLVTTIPVPGYGSGDPIDAVGDLDGDGRSEYVAVEIRPLWDPPPGGVWVYKATAPGTWEAVAMLENPQNNMGAALTCDMNANGRAEILWLGSPTSKLFAYEPTSDIVARTRSTQLTIFPSPVVKAARVQWGPSSVPVAVLVVHDVAGRIVQRHDARGDAIEWRPGRLAAGVYFLRLLDARGSAVASIRIPVVSSE